MNKLPPLNALRSFEFAARCGGFVQAGKELGVSSAAVSLQVKNLERFLGKELFLRQGNKILLTDAGEAIYPRIQEALGQLTNTTQIFQANKRRKEFVISVMPSLSELWLLPKLARVREAIDASIDIRVEADPVDFAKSNVDLRLTYGTRYYEEYLATNIFNDVAVPICSAEFWSRFEASGNTLETIPWRHFIHHKWGPTFGSEPTWDDWFKGNNFATPLKDGNGFTFNNTSLAIAAARRGLGIVLAPRILIDEDVEKGNLIVPTDSKMPMQHGYFAICSHAKGKSSDMKKVLKVMAG